MSMFFYNGHNMTDWVEVVSLGMSALPEAAPCLKRAAGRDGALYAGSTLEPLVITVEARLVTGTIEPAEIQRRWALVAALLRSDGPRRLCLSPGRYWLASLQGASELEFATYSAKAKLQFLCPDPVAYGETRSVTIPSGGYATFSVDGTYPARPRISAAAAVRDSTAMAWGLRLDDGDVLRVETGSSSARAVEVDCSERTCKVSGALSLPTLASDWFELSPGVHKVANDLGTGSCTVEFDERWV